MRPSALASTLFPLALVACGGATSVAEPRSEGAVAYLVLVPGNEGLRTEWLDRDGVVRGRAEGAVLGNAGRLYRFESRAERVTLRPCEEILGGVTNEEGDTGGFVASAALVGLGTAASVELITSPGDGGLQDFAHFEMTHEVLSALGDDLVIVTRQRRNACGAHDDVAVTVSSFDLATGAPVASPARSPAALAARTDEALAALRAVEPARSADCLPADGLTTRYVTSVPAFTGGRVVARHLYTTGMVSLPCAPPSDAPASSYEWSIWLEGDAGDLSTFGPDDAVPAAVLRRMSELRAVGVTWLDVSGAPLSDAFALTD